MLMSCGMISSSLKILGNPLPSFTSSATLYRKVSGVPECSRTDRSG